MKNALWSLIVSLVILGCASQQIPPKTPPQAPPQSGYELPPPQVPDFQDQNRVKEIYCSSAKRNGTLSSWITNPRTSTKARYFTGCQDPNGNDPRVVETTYLHKAKTADYPLNVTPGKVVANKAVQCLLKSDYCKTGTRENTLIQTTCKQNPETLIWTIGEVEFDCSALNNKGGKFTCHNGACVNVNSLVIDLAVRNISLKAEDCNSWITFQICNVGGQRVQSDFKTIVTVNGTNVEFIYPGLQSPIQPGQCVDINRPASFSIIALGLGLNQTVPVTIEVNPQPRMVSEINTSNNVQTNQQFFTGTDWMYNSTVKCETFCYDSDYESTYRGKDYFTFGALYSTQNGFAWQGGDTCVGIHQFNIWEKYCKTPTIVNGVATDLIGIQSISCTEAFLQNGQGIPGICQSGVCVPADRYGICQDTESGNSTLENGTVTYSAPQPAGANGYDPNLIFPLQSVRDTCINLNNLREEYCDPTQPNQHVTGSRSCNTPETPGFICDAAQGICVPGGTCTCSLKTQDGTVVTSNLINRVETVTSSCTNTPAESKTDSCYVGNSTTIFQHSCNPNGTIFTDTLNCNDFGPNYGCHSGLCVPPDENLKTCTDTDAQGVPDYVNYGTLSQTDAYGNQRASVIEQCDSDGIHLNEWYCGTDKSAIPLNFDCSSIQKVCKNGACVSP